MTEKDKSIKAVKSSVWLYGQKIVLTLFGLVSIAILARKLSPRDFGMLVLADTVLRFISVDGKDTVGQYVIHKKNKGMAEELDSAFWMNIVMLVVSAFLIVVLIPIISLIYREELLVKILVVSFIRFFLEQISVIPDSLIRRNIDFHKLVIRDTALSICGSAISIGMALSGFGIWSLVIPSIILAPFRIVIVMLMAKWKPSLNVNKSSSRQILSYIKPLIGSSLIGQINTNSDNLFIGKFVGSGGLGIYDRAWRSANITTTNIVSVVSDVSMPFLSKISNNTVNLQTAYLKILKLLGILTFPITIWLFIMADQFIIVLYGQQWVEAVLPLRILLVYTLRRSIGSPSTVVYNVIGKTNIAFKINCIFTPIFLLGVLIGGQFGIIGISFGVMLTKTLGGLISMHIASKQIGLSLMKILIEEKKPIEASIIMGLIIYLVIKIFDRFYPSYLIQLVLSIPLSIIIYIFLLRIRYSELLLELIDFIGKVSPSLAQKTRTVCHISY